MSSTEDAKDLDTFFYYGLGDLTSETTSDIYQGVIQPDRSLYYDRQNGCGLSSKENFPSSLTLEISAKYNIVKWLGYRNTQLPESEKDRRVTASQGSIELKQKDGKTSVSLLYIPFANISQPQPVQMPLGI